MNFGQMFATPEAREMIFEMMAQQMAQSPPEIREAISRVEVHIKRDGRGFRLRVGESDNEEVEGMIGNALTSWSDMLVRGFRAMGYRVTFYE